jgi:hypothetical protein
MNADANDGRPTPESKCASETCARPAEPGESHCAECGLERSLYLRDGRESASDRRIEALRETARRLFGG